MTSGPSAGVWGAASQSQGVANIVGEAAEKLGDSLSPSAQDRAPLKDVSGSSTETDTSSDLEKIGSTEGIEDLARQLTSQNQKVSGNDRKLARVNTAHSVKTVGGGYHNAFIDTSDPVLDPGSGQFIPEVWVKTLIGLQSRDPERYPQRVAGIGYRNLNVHGFGSLTDYQKFVLQICVGELTNIANNISAELSETTLLSSFPYSTSLPAEAKLRSKSYATSRVWYTAGKCWSCLDVRALVVLLS